MGFEPLHQQFGDDITVAGGGAGEHPGPLGESLGVGQVAVVAEGELDRPGPLGVPRGDPVHRLGVVPARRARGGVAGVADGQKALQPSQLVLVEDVGDEAHVFHHHDPVAVAGGHAGGLLAPVLQGVQAVVGQVGDVGSRGEHPEDPTGLSRGLVGDTRVIGGHVPHCLMPATAGGDPLLPKVGRLGSELAPVITILCAFYPLLAG